MNNCLQNRFRKKGLSLSIEEREEKFRFFSQRISLKDEVWKAIPNTDSLNFVSNLGRVASIRLCQPLILKQQTNSKGYYYVSIRYNDSHAFQNVMVHRLVAEAFVSNPDNKQIVHHIDQNTSNNIYSNLMFVNHEEHLLLHNKKPKATE